MLNLPLDRPDPGQQLSISIILSLATADPTYDTLKFRTIFYIAGIRHPKISKSREKVTWSTVAAGWGPAAASGPKRIEPC